MKKILLCEVLVSYSDFSEEFIIHTDDIKINLGGVII